MKNFKLIFVFATLFITGCGVQQDTSVSIASPAFVTPTHELPTPYAKIVAGQFLFIDVSGNDLCTNDCGECVVYEQTVPLYHFEDGKLFLNNAFGLRGVDDWKVFRANHNLIGLRYFSKEWSDVIDWMGETPLFEPIDTLPFDALLDIFVIQQIDLQGDIYLISNNQLTELKATESLTVSVTRQDQGLSCPVTHEYTLTNYGFIRDEDVVILNYGTPMP